MSKQLIRNFKSNPQQLRIQLLLYFYPRNSYDTFFFRTSLRSNETKEQLASTGDRTDLPWFHKLHMALLTINTTIEFLCTRGIHPHISEHQ